MNELNKQFCNACKNGNLELAQQLLRENPDISISAYNECAFRNACFRSHLEVARWLFQIKPTINISVCNDEAFRSACFNGHLEVAQWLLQVKPDIDISFNNEDAFRSACYFGQLKVAQWLADEVKPERYEITEVSTDENGKHEIHEIQYKIYPNNDRPLDYVLK